jgi:hypothetical protein
MEGTVVSFTATTGALVVNVTRVNGTGTYADWNINVSGVPGSDGAPGATGATGPQGPIGDISAPLGGFLSVASASSLQFKPFKGDRIKINGVIYQIPAAGIVGLGWSGVFIDGVSGQSLAANTLYRIYCFNNAGVLTADYSTTGHATSTTAGNVGIEIKSGDDTRSLIGLVYVSSAPATQAFYDTPTQRNVRSWFNTARIFCTSAVNAAVTQNTYAAQQVTARAVLWANESAFISSQYYASTDTGTSAGLQIFVDGTGSGAYGSFSIAVNWNEFVCSALADGPYTEGRHTWGGSAYIDQGTLNTYQFLINVHI